MHYHALPRSTKVAIKAGVALCVVILVGAGFYACVIDTPERKAAQAFEAALEVAKHGQPEDALRKLDDVLASEHRTYVGTEMEQKVGAEIVRITASLVHEPFVRTDLDQAGRLVRRYDALPNSARDGAARDAMLRVLDRWAAALATPDDQEAKLVLLRHAAGITDARRSADYSQRIAATRALAGAARAERSPVYALGILLDEPIDAACLAKAQEILVHLVDSPALIEEAGTAVDSWVASTPATEPLRGRVVAALERGRAAKAAADAADTAALTALVAKEPWNQHAVVKLARSELDAGAVASAEARLHALGAPAAMIRDARQTLAEIAFKQNQLDVADELFSDLLASQLQPFLNASQAYERAVLALQHQLDDQVRTNTLPQEIVNKLQGASPDQQQQIAIAYFKSMVESDPAVKKALAAVEPFRDVVPLSIFAGMTKVRRAQAATGTARDQLLADAERAFLAVRTQAEGQPAFHMGLGEVYARLGKATESDAELERVLSMNDPALTLQVAQVYRGIGSESRAKQIATKVYDIGPAAVKSDAALLMSLLTKASEDEQEQWLKKADQTNPFVKTSLLELQAARYLRQGKHAECDHAYAEVVAAHLAIASPQEPASYNNAALAQFGRFTCTGDLAALRDAEATLEKAYRTSADNSIVVHNLAAVLERDAFVRTLAKHVDIRQLRPTGDDADQVIGSLLGSSERDSILAELAADPGWRRSGELLAQAEVLAPNRVSAYMGEILHAQKLRDDAHAVAVLDRLKRVKTLDVSELESVFKDWTSGKDDARQIEGLHAVVARYDTLLSTPKLDARTRAAVLAIQASSPHRLGVYWSEPNTFARARAAREEAVKLWPAVVAADVLAEALIDEVAAGADAKRWAALRRTRSAAAALARLVADKDSIATKVLGSPEWTKVGALMRSMTGRPDLDAVRVARMLGDAALESRFKTVFDDTLTRVWLEAAVISTPSADTVREELAYFNQR